MNQFLLTGKKYYIILWSNNHFWEHDFRILKMKNMHTVLECVSDMESLHSNRAVRICWMGRVYKLEWNCRSRPEMTEYNIRYHTWYNLHTILPECFLNIGPQCWRTLPKHCLNFSPQCRGATLPQHSHNIAWALF